jgi:trigger factor
MPTVSPLQRLKHGRSQCTITFDEAETAVAEKAAVTKLGGAVAIQGFRPGKAPPELIKEKIKPEALLDETVRQMLPGTLDKLIADEKLRPIITPKLDLLTRTPLALQVTFIEKPEVKMGSIDTKLFQKQEPKFDEKDVDRMVQYLLQQYRTTEVVERDAADGDQITMNFVGTDAEGQEVQGTRSTGYQVVIGSNSLIPGFEEGLKGLKKGDKKDLKLQFPEKYHAEQLAGKPVTFSVEVTQVEKVNTPPLTDAFVKEKQMGENVQELRTRITDSMRAEEEKSDRQRREQLFFDTIRKATKLEIAPELVEQEKRYMYDELSEQLQQQRQSPQEWMERTKRTPETLDKEFEEESKNRITLRFGVQQLLDDKKIELTPEEEEKLLPDFLANVPPDEQEGAKAQYGPGSSGFEELKWRKRVEKLVEQMLA